MPKMVKNNFKKWHRNNNKITKNCGNGKKMSKIETNGIKMAELAQHCKKL